MSESGNYPPGAENDPNAPWNQVDLMEKYEDVVEEMYLERLQDINGWFIESLTEAPDEFLVKLSECMQQWVTGPASHDKDIEVMVGKMILNRFESYCLPVEDDLTEELDRRNHD